jgi:light-regulated signal transduction histidine kinase (bacteriophytochrome)
MADAEPDRIAALEAELAALRAEMQDFTYTVSHDLRASLRHILSYAQLVQEDAGPLLPEETQGFLHTIADSARHMGLLMDGLMELSRLGTVALQTAPVPLQPLLHELQAEFSHASGAEIAWQVAADLPVVLADPTLLRAALHAVLDNAVKFTARKELRQIAVLARDAGNAMVTLQVRDNGAGFNPALQAKLFHPFARLHTARQFPGIGMGLALTRKMLQRMGAQVHAEGVPDGGCTLSLRLARA